MEPCCPVHGDAADGSGKDAGIRELRRSWDGSSSCLGHGSCWEAPALPGTWDSALLTHLGQDQEQMGFFLLLCGKNV